MTEQQPSRTEQQVPDPSDQTSSGQAPAHDAARRTGILVGIDGSPQASRALAWAVAEGARRQVPVTALYAWVQTWDDDASTNAPETRDEVRAAKQAYAEELVAHATADLTADADVRVLAVHGWPAEEILTHADHLGVEMIVVGRSGLGRMGRFIMGSVSNTVVQKAHVPVTVVAGPGAHAEHETDAHDAHDAPEAHRPHLPRGSAPVYVAASPAAVEAAETLPRVVVGVDGSRASQLALREAAAAAERVGGVLQPVLAWQITSVAPVPTAMGWVPPVEDYQAWAEATLTDACSDAGVVLPSDRVLPTVMHTTPARGVLWLSVGAERVVVGSRGLGGFERLVLGSVSRQVLEAAACPVTVIHAPHQGHDDADPGARAPEAEPALG